jgi:hypothetical protein
MNKQQHKIYNIPIMKKIKIISAILVLFVSLSMSAQTEHKDYFVGKWNVVAVGTPSGDSKMIVSLSRKNGKLEGTIIRSGLDPKEISKVEETPNSVKVYFRHLFYRVKLTLVEKDENHVAGSLMDKYKASGVRLN